MLCLEGNAPGKREKCDLYPTAGFSDNFATLFQLHYFLTHVIIKLTGGVEPKVSLTCLCLMCELLESYRVEAACRMTILTLKMI